jgi:glycosyltransferase involved in cell wall biosynthesis
VKWFSFLKTGTVSDYDALTAVLARQDGFKMATFWRTAFTVAEATKGKGNGLYLVQDKETSYTSQPAMSEVVMKTYALPLQKITTSRWVEKNLPDVIHIGIGISSLYKHSDGKANRNSQPLGIARRQALKGFSELMEVARYLHKEGKTLSTFGLDQKLVAFTPVQHFSRPDDRSVRAMYNTFGCFVSTSRHEGFSLPPLEAMACRCPVVTSHADGNEEYCEDGVNCLMGNNPREIADHVLRVLRDKELAQALSKRALEVPRRYSWDKVIDSLEKLMI